MTAAGKRGGNIDTIVIKPEEGLINVLWAGNKEGDRLKEGDEGKMRVSDIMMALWNKVNGKAPQDVRTVRFEDVIEETTAPALHQALKAMGQDMKEGETSVQSTAKEGDPERVAFDAILNSGLGKVTNKMIQEFSVGKTITKFEITQPDKSSGSDSGSEAEGPTLTVHLA